MFAEKNAVQEEIIVEKYAEVILNILNSKGFDHDEKSIRINSLKKAAERVGILEKLDLRLNSIDIAGSI